MSKDKDYNIHVKVPGVEQAKADLDKVSAAADKLSNNVQQNNAKQADSFQTAQAKGESYFGKMAQWAIGLFSVTKVINEITKAIQMQTAALEENARVAESQQNKLLRLQFLGEYFKEKPELRQEVSALSEYGRRPFEEVADAYYNLRSKAGMLPQDQQSAIMKEALEMGRTDPSMQLNTLVDMFSLYAKLTGSKDMNQVQNVLQKTVEQAGAGGAEVASYMPQFLPIGLSGGLTGAQAAGLWAYATTQTANPAIATTGLKATFMGLQGKGSPESAKLLKQYGISEGMDFQTKINTLSSAYQSGRFDLASAEQLAGREGASILLSLLQNPQAMNQMMANVVSADRGDVDLTGSMINQLMGSDETARREENIRLLKVTIANQKARDPEAMKYQETQLRNELILRKTGADEWGIAMQKGLTGFIYGAGYGDYLDTIQQYGPTVENSLKQKGVLPEGYSSGPTVINNYNNNVVYNRAETPASPRVSPKDIN